MENWAIITNVAAPEAPFSVWFQVTSQVATQETRESLIRTCTVAASGGWEEVKWSESHSVVSDSLHRLCSPWILQARILEWIAFLSSRGSSQPRDWAQVSRIAGGFFTSCSTREARSEKTHALIPQHLLSCGIHAPRSVTRLGWAGSYGEHA